MPAPWTSPTKASDSAGTSSDGTSRSIGATGSGSERGIAPSSPTMATPLHPSTAVPAEVTMTASTSPSGPSLVRSSSRISAIVTSPTTRDCRWNWCGWARVTTARTRRLAPLALYPVRLASWPRTILTPTALMNPTITAFDTNRRTDPSRANPAASITTPVSTDRVNNARGVLSLVNCRDVGDDYGHGAGGLHRHDSRAEERTADRAERVRVKPGQGIDPGEQAGREAVGNAFHPEHQPGAASSRSASRPAGNRSFTSGFPGRSRARPRVPSGPPVSAKPAT